VLLVALMSAYVPGVRPVADGVLLHAKPFTKRQSADFPQRHAGG
jgi:hypothetical protein